MVVSSEGELWNRSVLLFQSSAAPVITLEPHPFSLAAEKEVTELARGRGPGTSMFCLSHPDCCDRKAAMEREGPMELGQCCSEPSSISTFSGNSLLLWQLASPQIWTHLEYSEGLTMHVWTEWFEKYCLHERHAPT